MSKSLPSTNVFFWPSKVCFPNQNIRQFLYWCILFCLFILSNFSVFIFFTVNRIGLASVCNFGYFFPRYINNHSLAFYECSIKLLPWLQSLLSKYQNKQITASAVPSLLCEKKVTTGSHYWTQKKKLRQQWIKRTMIYLDPHFYLKYFTDPGLSKI